jgi:hypothetical protein
MPEDRDCRCPERDGMIYHQEGTCTDPVAATLGWYASAAEILRLFEIRVAGAWDLSGWRRGELDAIRQTVLDVAAGRLPDAAIDEIAARGAGNEHAAATLAGQCRSVIRDATAVP